ncbi:sulfate ABC transporter substrate-binding protein [uncultured Rhodoblastus sp.]|uniref:sulfate ABC transporter substrate-binding protein n=1 Tax=uncultured Rhodoblastus sp. TaxID=543037 RepID=UPI0025FB7165|nr:sulfate ABC transporter substrate-binding protein [uncultured Rhodoblastus sp.]
MRIPWLSVGGIAAAIFAIGLIAVKNVNGYTPHHLLNVSYDPTRELYQKINPAFAARYEKQTGEQVAIRQSHGGSSYQARQVATGALNADVVTLGLPSDVEGLAKRGIVAADWKSRLPNNARPYYSTVVFVVRKGNPLNIRDWPDLVRGNIEVITPDPKTSGNGKLTLLAAWGSVISRGGSEAEARDFIKALLDHAPFLVPAARVAGVAFSVEKKGDVSVAWENEALREVAETKGAVEIVYPPLSILAEPVVAWVDANVAKNHSEKLSKAYLEYLFTDEAQNIIAREGYRPFNAAIAEKYVERLPRLNLFPITLIARDWSDANQKFFAENGVVDAIYTAKPRAVD